MKLLSFSRIVVATVALSTYFYSIPAYAEETRSIPPHLSLSGNASDIRKKIDHVFEKKIYLKNVSGKFFELSKEQLLKVIDIQENSFFNELKLPPLTHLNFKKEGNFTELLLEKGQFSSEAQDVIIKKDTTPSGYTITGKLIDGYTVDELKTQEMLLQLLEKNDVRALEIPIIKKSGGIIQDGNNIPMELVTQGVSDFHGSTNNRIHNIVTAYTRFQGATIAPNETFSFNKILGEVDGSTGYKKELVIKGPKTVPDWGGGVCQVSSTFFRAALEGGLPITERRNHSYAVSFYEPWGTDATIYTGVQDLQFVNNTQNPLIIHVYHEGTKLYVNFYGKKDTRKVELIGPMIYDRRGTPSPTVENTTSLPSGKEVLKEYGHPGFTAQWTRNTTMPDGTFKKDTFTSIYEARPGKVSRGI